MIGSSGALSCQKLVDVVESIEARKQEESAKDGRAGRFPYLTVLGRAVAEEIPGFDPLNHGLSQLHHQITKSHVSVDGAAQREGIDEVADHTQEFGLLRANRGVPTTTSSLPLSCSATH